MGACQRVEPAVGAGRGVDAPSSTARGAACACRCRAPSAARRRIPRAAEHDGHARRRKSAGSPVRILRELGVREDGVRRARGGAPARGVSSSRFPLAADAARRGDITELLADGIDGRVRHLGELLLEVAEEALRAESPGRRAARRCPCCRWAPRRVGRHRREQDAQVLARVAELAGRVPARVGRERVERRRRRRDRGRAGGRDGRRGLARADPGDLHLVRAHPLRRTAAASTTFRLDLLVGDDRAPPSVSTRNILPGERRAFSLHVLAASMSSTPSSLAQTTRPSCVTTYLRRPQAVAVERRADERRRP